MKNSLKKYISSTSNKVFLNNVYMKVYNVYIDAQSVFNLIILSFANLPASYHTVKNKIK